MKIRFIATLLSLLIALSVFAGCGGSGNSNIPDGGTDSGNTQQEQEEEENMTKTEKEYRSYFENDLKNFPINFVYGNTCYRGFDPKYFSLSEKSEQKSEQKEETVYIFNLDNVLQVRLETAFYREYNAYEWTVYFSNISSNENSAQLKYVNAVDMEFEGANPHLKGILGDHVNQYKPYDYDLKEQTVNFTCTSGRATHEYFPYFNLETDAGGAMLALGWAGTWQADFVCGEDGNTTHYTGTGTVGMNTYLKPGETVRTPLVAVVRYYERDEDVATNAWRKWYVDCNMPKESVENPVPVQPQNAYTLSMDTGRPNSDGSISEYYGSWKNSLDTIYDKGLKADFRWFDAGWYLDPYMNTVPSDWWGTVGTWELDNIKWPDNTFRESVEYAAENGTKTLMWFEPERVTHLDGLVANYGYKREWVLSDHGNNNCYVNNLGNEECLEWTLNRILTTMEETGVDLYREDFNIDPQIFFSIGDGYEGEGRIGITENLYYQGHYKLWDEIIAYCAENGKCTYVDSCASGGGRNDLESMRRGVPFLRSDSDRTTIALRLAMTTTLVKWLPYTGAIAKESADQLTNGVMDLYVMRATYLPLMSFAASFYYEKDSIDWDVLLQAQEEHEMIAPYMLKDFYVLTPYRGVSNNTQWTAYQYFDPEKSEGVVQAFRPDDCVDSEYTVALRGLDPEKTYSVTDLDGVNSIAKVKGSFLMQGIQLYAEEARTAIVLMIKEAA